VVVNVPLPTTGNLTGITFKLISGKLPEGLKVNGAFIAGNPYLFSRRGQFAERNGYVLPWTHKLDLNFTQDVTFVTGKDKHTLRFTADIYNFTNLLNKDWGVYYIPTTTSPLVYQRMDTDGRTPIYTFPYLDAVNKVPFTRSHRPSTGLGSRYQIQLGVRYLFN
jgi:hypothetical protein